MARKITLPALKGSRGPDYVTTYDSVGEFADAATALGGFSTATSWHGSVDAETVTKRCRTGDLSRVPASDTLMSKLEKLASYETKTFRAISTVAGGMPDVPAFLAGHPLNMRRRERVLSERAPLAIVVDLVSSAGVPAKELEERGAALLALARVLSAMRPVTFWVAVSAMPEHGTPNSSSAVAFKLDTAPLDIARAAHVLGSPGVPRLLAYRMIAAQVNTNQNSIGWPYDDAAWSRANGVKYWQRVFGFEDVLFVAGPYVGDPITKRPAEWLRETVAKYGGTNV